MKIHWYGHSCCMLTNAAGKRLLMDPFNEKVGYIVPRFEADVVTVSHSHFDHSNIDAVKGNYKVFREAGTFTADGFRITGIPSFHDDNGGKDRGSNMIFVVESDGYSVCHLGDLGHILPKETVEMIGRPDVLLLPIGGGYTIDAKKAVEVMNQLSPRVTVPVHYKTKDCQIKLAELDDFLNVEPTKVVRYVAKEVDIESLLKTAHVAVMDYGE